MMKKALLFTFAQLLFGSSLYAQELPFTIKYQDRGVTLNHKSCRLAVNGLMFDTQVNIDLLSILNEKGYTAYLPQEQGVAYGPLGRATNVFRDDLVLTIRKQEKNLENKFYLQGRLGQLEDDFFRPNNFWGEATEISGVDSFDSQNIKGVDYKEALSEVYNSLPACVSYGSGHIFEEENYYASIAKGEISNCFELYGLGTPKETHKQELRQFFKNVGYCYSQVQKGERCDQYESDLRRGLNKNSQKLIENYLQHIGQEEISQRIGDFLGSTKLCSAEARKAKKMNLKKILNKMSKTL